MDILAALKNAYADSAPSENRMRGWKAADLRHNMSVPTQIRNSRETELGDHYSVGADLGPAAGPTLAVLQEMVGRPVLAAYPDLGNKLAPSVFNFKTAENNRPGSVDPYIMPTYAESGENLKAAVAGALDKYPRLQKLLGLGDALPADPYTQVASNR